MERYFLLFWLIAFGASSACKTKEECPENHYCGGRAIKQRCIECFNCTEVNRQPKQKSYDSESCATHPTECGDCFSRFEDLGGMCHPIEKSIPTSGGTEQGNNDTNFGKDGAQHNSVAMATSSYILLGILPMILVVAVFCVKCFLGRKERLKGEEETTGLTNAHDPLPPTAPLAEEEEYRRQPPYATSAHVRQHKSKYFPTRGFDQMTQARPFQAGNGAGSWHRTDSDEESFDTVDGSHLSSPTDQQNRQHRRGPPVEPFSDAQGNAVALNRAQAPVSRGTNQQNVPPLMGHPAQDPVVGQLRFQANVFFEVQQGRYYATNHNANGNSRDVVSAPNSPRLIDDTVLDLTQLNGSFASFDSGTGTNDHDRSVPSRPASPDSEMDIEDDTEFSNAQEPVSQRLQHVPDM